MSYISRISPPDISFAHHYRAHVLPQLSSLMPVSACLIVIGGESFAEEYDFIVRVGWNLGGWFLLDSLWRDVEDWVSEQLLEAIDAMEAELEDCKEAEDDFSQDTISRRTASAS